ncbi:MAG: Isoleucine--tRNA ligase [Actinobacteria bacterium]|nr:Isoleucine--tRNA ligase [Actinomycetota bacterium]
MEYKDTLNLPQTSFSMRANLATKEPEILDFWDEIGLYQKTLARNKGRKSFILHDGPPYSNGDIHMGHALNKVLKDMIVKYKSLRGYYAPYVPGWDNHGLPIENKVVEMVKEENLELDRMELRRRCRDYAFHFVDVQRQQFKRLGVRGDWENPYLTLNNDYEAIIVKVFSELVAGGYVYRGLRPIHWCTSCQTALAEAEIEYEMKVSPSIYVKFPVKEDPQGIFGGKKGFILIWTTTPWTIPANLAIVVHPEYDYVILKTREEELYLVAQELVELVAAETHLEDYQIVARYKGGDLKDLICTHPFLARPSPVLLGDYVTLDQGTGCVHTAPGHGREDFLTGQQYGLEILCPVDERGIFDDRAGQFRGMYVEDANPLVVEAIAQNGLLLKVGQVEHQYPHCWRCHNPVIFRTTVQWFMSVDHQGLRQKALKEIDQVEWIPRWGRNRIYAMVAERPDWCLSRQRFWGVGIPIFYCQKCGEPILDKRAIECVYELVKKEGSDAWFTKNPEEILPSDFNCSSCGGNSFRKENDILDVWFDSGSSHRAVLETRPELSWPADMYLEGSDQHRGWFNSSLMVSMATRDRAPYRSVLTHGFMVDDKGRKMAKSLGNVISPLDVMRDSGADILRLWVSSTDYRGDVGISPSILKQVTDTYRRIRNTARFLLGNLYDFDPDVHALPYQDLWEVDRWALQRLRRLTEQVTRAYQEYQFHLVYHYISNFCAVEMSARYLDILKDRLYTSAPDAPGRRSAQTVLFKILTYLTSLLCPVLSFTCEEIWQSTPDFQGKEESIHLRPWPDPSEIPVEEEVERKFDEIMTARDEVFKRLEVLRGQKTIGDSLRARVRLFTDDENLYSHLMENRKSLEELYMVSEIEVERELSGREPTISLRMGRMALEVEPAAGKKCERCWKYLPSVGSNIKHPQVCAGCLEILELLGIEVLTKL